MAHFKQIIRIAISIILLSSFTYAKSFSYDTAHSNVGFTVSHMVVTKVHGSFNKVDADLFWNPKNLKKSYLNGTISVASINTKNEKRDNHLQDKEFFNSDEFPTITFKSTSIKAIKSESNTYTLKGKLTIKDVTKTISCPLKTKGPIIDPWNNERIGFEATCNIKRMDYNIYENNTLKSGELIIGDDIAITISVEGIAKAN